MLSSSSYLFIATITIFIIGYIKSNKKYCAIVISLNVISLPTTFTDSFILNWSCHWSILFYPQAYLDFSLLEWSNSNAVLLFSGLGIFSRTILLLLSNHF